MKFECSLEKIKNALLTVEKVTGKNLTLPVLGSILWVASGKKIKLRATNLNVGIEVTVDARVEKEGTVAIRGDILSSLFSSLSGDSSVSFEKVDQTLSVKTKTSTILLKTIPNEDFPTLPTVDGVTYEIPAKKITEGIKAVLYAASTSEVKPEIGSIFIYPEDDMLVFVATDSFRLAEKKIKIKQKLSFEGILFPVKNAVEYIKAFDNNNDTVSLTVSKNQIIIQDEKTYFTSRVIDGVFPDYKQIIPKKPTTDIVVLKQDLLSSLKISNIFTDKLNQISFTVRPTDKIFEVESKNNDIGENTTFIPGSFSGEEVSVYFNYKYIIDSFSSLSSDSLKIELSGNNKPMVIKPVGDVSFMYLVMPMNK